MISYFPVVTGSLSVSGSVNISGGITASGGITISGSIASASYAATASFVALAQSASNAVSAATASFANALTVAGNLTAQTLVVQTITSSVDFVTGSTRFGSILDNTHVFSGSVTMNPGGLFVSSSGIVGVGTISPSSTFHVRGLFGAPSTTGNSLNGVVRFGQTSGFGGLDIGFGDPYSWLQSRNSTDYSVNYNLVLQPNGGNVGIGTTSPTSILQVKGTGTYDFISISNGSTSGGGGILTRQNATASSWFGNSGGWEGGTSNDTGIGSYAGGIRFYTNGGTEKMRITSGGNVGIGTTSTNYKLQVDGRVSCGTIVQGNFIAGQIAGNLNAAAAPNFILVFNMTDSIAGWSLAGTVNAAAWDCWNISTIWIRRLYDTFTVNAGITGLYKSGCDFAICDVTYNSKRYIALRFTSNPEIDVMWTGYGLNSQFSSDGTITPISLGAGVTVNSVIAAY